MYNVISLFNYDKTDLSAEKEKTREDPWFFGAEFDKRRTSYCPSSSPFRESETFDLKLVFPQRKRLPRADFPLTFKSGRRVSSSNFTAVLSKGDRGYAVIVPKKVARLSVTRHRIKRRVLAALRALPLSPSVILFPSASVLDMEYDALQQELIKLLS